MTKRDDQNLIEKLPPQSIEAEEALLGSLLIDKDAIFKIIDLVKDSDFYKDAHRLIFETMLEIFNRQNPIDILSLSSRLEEKKQLETVGGRSYLVSLTNKVPSAIHIDSYAQIVQRKAILRRLIQAGGEIVRNAYEEKDPVENILDRSEQKIFSISQVLAKKDIIILQDKLSEAVARIEENHREGSGLKGVPTGFNDLDGVLSGLQKSDLIILASRPSVGKSSLALDIARNAAINHKIPVAIFSLEMSHEQIVDRMISAEGNVNLWSMRTGHLSKEDGGDFARVNQAINNLSNGAPILIDDSPMLRVLEIRAKARRLQAEYGLGLIILDYLQLMEGGNQENRVQEVSEISRALKATAKELNIPILALSQLSRLVEARIPAIPKLSDLRESGSIEQDADVVLFLYRKAADMGMRNKILAEEKNIAEVHVAKHRHGPAGLAVKLYFDSNIASFKNLSKEYLEVQLPTEEPF
ncbi:MAG: replicative DNA helicase [Patescibacteria group bacterium]